MSFLNRYTATEQRAFERDAGFSRRDDRIIAEVVGSDGKTVYEVRQGKEDQVYYCTCRGWVALNKGPKAKGGPCKHMKLEEVAALIAARRLSHQDE
jgi:hypothetical protein